MKFEKKIRNIAPRWFSFDFSFLSLRKLLVEDTDEHFTGHELDAPELDVALLAVGGGHHTTAVVEVGQVPVQLSAAEIGHHSVLLAPGVEPVHDKQLGVLVSNLHTNKFTFIIYLLLLFYNLFIIY